MTKLKLSALAFSASSAVVAAFFSAPVAAQQKFISVGTGGVTGVYYAAGGAMRPITVCPPESASDTTGTAGAPRVVELLVAAVLVKLASTGAKAACVGWRVS